MSFGIELDPRAAAAQAAVFTPEMLWKRAKDAASLTAAKVASKLQIPVERVTFGGNCTSWANQAEQDVRSEIGMFDRRIHVMRFGWIAPNKTVAEEFDAPHHDFIGVRIPGIDELRIIDGTWRQFLPEDATRAEAASLLHGGLEDAMQFAIAAGMDESRTQIWHDARVFHGGVRGMVSLSQIDL